MKLEELVNAAGVNRLVGFFFFFFVIYFKNYGILRFFFPVLELLLIKFLQVA